MTKFTFPLATSSWDEREYAAIQRVIDSGNFTMGREAEAFEHQFAKAMELACRDGNSGSSANLLAIAASIIHRQESILAMK
ncbi:MAG: DegT/DnrJ/EryC1/StrS family aminotransferase [Nitratireductor sp.]